MTTELRCYNCGEPDSAGTQAENLEDMRRKGRQRVYDNHGALNPRAKLTQVDVDAIRIAAAAGMKRTELSKMYGVCMSNIDQIVKGQRWK